MEQITLGDIAKVAAFVVAFGGSVWTIIRAIDKAVKKAFEPIRMDICKNFLVQVLSGAERGEDLTEMEKIRLAEQYTYYTSHDGNSYIKEWHDRLKQEGKL